MIDPPGADTYPVAVVVNEEEWLARSIEAVLVEHGYVVRRTASARETLALVGKERPDAVILDRRLPDTDGAALCRQLRDDPRVGRSVPIAITSMVPLSAGERAEFFRAGAWDLWGPLLEPELFAVKLDTFVSGKLTAELQAPADHDTATGLMSSLALSNRAREMGAVLNRVGASLTCVAIASLNPPAFLARSSEHADSLFRYLAKVWRSQGRAADAIGRLSPAEIGIIAPGTNSAGAVAMFRRVQDLLAAGPTNGQVQPRTAIRAGYCAAENLKESSLSAPEMLRRAAVAVRYAAAEGGDSDIVSYDDVPQQSRH